MLLRYARPFFASFMFVISTMVATAQSRPPQPFLDRGACPFECCTYRQWTVEKPTAIYRDMTTSSAVVHNLKRGERVMGLTGVVITNEPGIATTLKDTVQGRVHLKSGDRIFLLTNVGEGFVKAWFKGRTFQAEALDETLFKILRQPTSVWWVKVRNSRGKKGWSRQPENFGNMDQCG